ncbi:glycosyltransferase [Acuticoccus sediminis]|uniref:Glycosyltransferase n=1 Tax=Acuticoccus sediminis TaxID=2184697 RepID=A0A8B2NRE1_9HYPH|nr:glycosyltransferase [Acuticoccus sediminis]RAH98806.1 glycosyltransferase [Acuticoccus sediminis]
MSATCNTIAVVIPHYDDRVRLRRCLEALAPQLGTDVEVVVVDNNTPGGLADVATPDGVRIAVESRRGAANARNRGVAETDAPVIAFLDSDCIPMPDWLTTIRGHAEEVGRSALVLGGRVDICFESPPPRSGAEAFERVFAFDQKGYVETKGFAVTANLVVSRETFARVGPFRDGVSEDVDWCHRARAAGADLRYAPDLAVDHPARADWPALKRKWRRLTAEGFALRQASGGSRLGWALRALAMPVSVLAHTPRVVAASGLGGGEKWRAFATLARLRTLRMVWMLNQAATGRP